MSLTIDTVETIPLSVELDEPFGYSQAWVTERTGLLVRLTASDGTVGWGECWGPIAGTKETIDGFLAPRLVGRNPRNIEEIHDDLHQLSRAAYQSVIPLPAISGVDIGLWDLLGKVRGVSVTDLLGGRRREAVRAYATGHYFRDISELSEQYRLIAAEAAENADRFGAIKAKIGLQLLGYGSDEDVELVRRIREAIGPDATLMVDANYAYDRATAREVGRSLAELGVHWFEEPVDPEDETGYVALRDVLDVRIAGGECHPPAAFTRLFEAGGLDIAQPDICNVGGITAAKRVATLAQGAHVPVVPHVWGTPIALAASLQFIGSLYGSPWLEFDNSPNPLRTELATTHFAPDERGRVSIPKEPGLGVELEEAALERFRAN